MQYIAYYRVSTQMQGKSGLGIDTQRSAVKAFVGANTVLAEFTEIESGKNADRPQLALALQAAKDTGATLLFAKLDRLSRNLNFITNLMEEKVPMVACDMPYANKFQWHIMGAVAEQERDFISERTKAAIAKRREQGVKWGENTVKVKRANNFAQSLHKDIQSIMQAGYDTPAAIARELNERGVRTSRGCRWGSGQIVRLLRRLGLSNLELQ